MKFKDAFLINERKVELDGKTFKSEKEAGFYLGSIGKTYEDIMKLLDVPEDADFDVKVPEGTLE